MFNLFLHNYRSFQNQNLNLSRINILIGENSGGKSSVLKLLLALKQTLDSPTEVNLKLTGDYTDLGNYDEVVYYKNKRKNIVVGFEVGPEYFDFFINYFPLTGADLSNSKINEFKEIVNDYSNSKTKLVFTFSSKLNQHSSIKTKITNDKIGSLEIIQKKGEGASRFIPACDLMFEYKKLKGELLNCTTVPEGFLTLLNPDFRKKCEEIFGKQSNYVFYTSAFLLIAQNYIEDYIQKIRFVNPIGTALKRFYFKEDKKATYKLMDIEKFVNILYDDSAKGRGAKSQLELLNKTIKEFGIAEEVEVVKDKQLPVLALNVKTKDFWSNITDVGFGVSMQIPILFQAILSERFTRDREIILVEQPELHLHPALQAKFIEVLLGLGNKNIYFIETHSEHIIRKLQVLVKANKFNIKPDDISIHYFKRKPKKFEITEHKINQDGKLNPLFPEGFYDTSYTLVKQLLK